MIGSIVCCMCFSLCGLAFMLIAITKKNTLDPINFFSGDDSLKGKGLASEFFEYAADRALELGFNNLRVDTHPENVSMQRLIAKNGFIKCGIVYMSDKTSRYAYQKVLK